MTYRDHPPIEQTESWLAMMRRRAMEWFFCLLIGLGSGSIAFHMGYKAGRLAPPLPAAPPCADAMLKLPKADGARVSCAPEQKSFIYTDSGYLYCYCER